MTLYSFLVNCGVLQAVTAASKGLTGRFAAVQQLCSALQDELSAAQQASSAASFDARKAQQQVVILQRQLLRARAAGNKAVDVAREKSMHLQATGTAAVVDPIYVQNMSMAA